MKLKKYFVKINYSKKMTAYKDNIIYVPTWSLKYGGPVTSIYNLLKIIGKDATLISKSFEHQNKKVNYLSKNQSFLPFWRFLFSKLFFKLIFSTKRTYLFINGCWDLVGLFLIIFGVISKKRIIIHPRGMLLIKAVNKNKFIKNIIINFIYKPLENHFQLFLCSSKKEKKDLLNIFPNSKIIIIPNYQYLPKIRSNKKKINFNKKRLLFLSRIYPKKGIIELLQAWSKINLKNWELIICGPIEEDFKKRFFRMLKDLPKNNYKYLGLIKFSKRYSLLTSCDAFILPSHHENFGNVILEALHAGLPVITSRNTPWEIIEENSCGKLINASVEEIIGSLYWLDSLNDIQLKKMSKKSKIISKDFNIFNSKNKILSIFK